MMVHPRLRPNSRDRLAATTGGLNKARISTLYNKYRQSTSANKTSRPHDFSKEKSAASIRLSVQQLPKTKLIAHDAGGDTSRTDLEVVNPSMHIAEPEETERIPEDCRNLNQRIPSHTRQSMRGKKSVRGHKFQEARTLPRISASHAQYNFKDVYSERNGPNQNDQQQEMAFTISSSKDLKKSQ